MPARRFPSPWSVEELDACFVIRDHGGQKLTYVYFEDEPGRRSAAKLLSKDEARPRCFELKQQRGAGSRLPGTTALEISVPLLGGLFGGHFLLCHGAIRFKA
jgi:hypothetical protein